MIGIDIGAGHVTFSSAANLPPVMHNSPADLVLRVAADLPVIEIKEDRCQTTRSAVLFAQVIADALKCIEDGSTPEGRPVRGAIAVPGWWSPRTLGRVKEALFDMGIEGLLINDAEAAVMGSLRGTESAPRTYAVVAVRDQYTSVVLVQTDGKRPRAFLSPTFVIDEGGRFLDSAILQHLIVGLKDMGLDLDSDSDTAISQARAALPFCRELREKLSYSSAESLKLDLGDNTKAVRIARSELEELAAPWLDNLVSNLISMIAQSRSVVDEVLLVGGLAAMPLVSQRISAELDLPVAVAPDPQTVVAEGARLLAQQGANYRDRLKIMWGKRSTLKFWVSEQFEATAAFLGFPPSTRLRAHRAGAKHEH